MKFLRSLKRSKGVKISIIMILYVKEKMVS